MGGQVGDLRGVAEVLYDHRQHVGTVHQPELVGDADREVVAGRVVVVSPAGQVPAQGDFAW